jgi:hypothetical protein
VLYKIRVHSCHSWFFLFAWFAVNLPAQDINFSLTPNTVRPGEPITLVIDKPYPEYRAKLLDVSGRTVASVPFFALKDGKRIAACIAIPASWKDARGRIRVEPAIPGLGDLGFSVQPRTFESEVIPLDEENTAIRSEETAEKTAQSKTLNDLLNSRGNTVYTYEAFKAPLTSTRRTSQYGEQRVFVYTDGRKAPAVHAGVDYGVPKGTGVFASAAGRVRMAVFRINTGNSVVIEHLPGLYSCYYHLDSMDVQEGDEVKQGQRIGLSGATGLATGPHLHWEIRLNGENADPDAFTKQPLLP